jgi:sugar lactone lactonase YvrE
MQPELLIDARADLGEGPAWDARTQSLYWLDIYGKKVHRYRDGRDQVIAVDEMPGCLAPRADGHVIVALRGRIADLEPDSGKLTTLLPLDGEPAGNRINDGKCDPMGRFLVGTMDNTEQQVSGSLYSYNGKTLATLLSGLGIANGLAWSRDTKTFYYIDTPTRQVQAFDYDLASGTLANGRVVIEIPESLGWPDGMTSDTNGHLWIAMWDGAQVTRWDPDSGALLEQIPIPAPHSSCPVFGGPDMNELFVTSARKGMTEDELKQYPHSGGVFRLKTKVTGMPTFEFKY